MSYSLIIYTKIFSSFDFSLCIPLIYRYLFLSCRFFIIPHKGTAINTEENTPDTNPINNANEKLNKLDAQILKSQLRQQLPLKQY